MALRVRELSEEEREQIKRLSQSRTAAARSVERARIIQLASAGLLVPAISARLHLAPDVARLWLKRFNASGLAGLTDQPRAGRPATYTSEQVGEVIATALMNPTDLGQPFGSWTFERLATYLNEVKGIAIKRSRVHQLLRREGLRWRQQETWFGARVDPDFAQKRGRLRPSTPPHQTAAS
ncbi:MAG TPA: helix-turn-helix domain-containing protein [Ktedonobacterales bacterium]|nr:helix-turn-helix domain-containing protein [Ktedonobacterales bacterium]